MAEASVQGRIHSVFWKDLSAYFFALPQLELFNDCAPSPKLPPWSIPAHSLNRGEPLS